MLEHEAERDESWLPLPPATKGGGGGGGVGGGGGGGGGGMAAARPLSEQGWPVRRFSVAARDDFGAAGTALTHTLAEGLGLGLGLG